MRARLLVPALILAALAASLPAGARQAGPAVSVLEEPMPWREKAALVMEHGSLAQAVRANGYAYAAADEIYLAEIVPGVGGPAMVLHDALGGAFSLDFYPASAVKLLASVAALEYLGTMWFEGDATLTAPWLGERTLRSIYEPAIVRSDNLAYDLLVRVAGVDFINLDFVPRYGLSSVVISSDLSGLPVLYSPSYTVSTWVDPADLPPVRRWGGDPIRYTRTVPSRSASRQYRYNDADLFDLAEVVRRVMLHDELPPKERFDLADGDVAALQAALCDAQPAHYEAGARRVFGDDAEVCGKSGRRERRPPDVEPPGGDGSGDDGVGAGESRSEPELLPACVDVALISDPDTGRRVLLAATGECTGAGLAALAAPALLGSAGLTGTPLQPDAGVPAGVSMSVGEEGGLVVAVDTAAWWALVSVDGGPPVPASRRAGVLQAVLPLPGSGRHLLVVRAVDFGVEVGYRAVGFEVSGV